MSIQPNDPRFLSLLHALQEPQSVPIVVPEPVPVVPETPVEQPVIPVQEQVALPAGPPSPPGFFQQLADMLKNTMASETAQASQPPSQVATPEVVPPAPQPPAITPTPQVAPVSPPPVTPTPEASPSQLTNLATVLSGISSIESEVANAQVLADYLNQASGRMAPAYDFTTLANALAPAMSYSDPQHYYGLTADQIAQGQQNYQQQFNQQLSTVLGAMEGANAQQAQSQADTKNSLLAGLEYNQKDRQIDATSTSASKKADPMDKYFVISADGRQEIAVSEDNARNVASQLPAGHMLVSTDGARAYDIIMKRAPGAHNDALLVVNDWDTVTERAAQIAENITNNIGLEDYAALLNIYESKTDPKIKQDAILQAIQEVAKLRGVSDQNAKSIANAFLGISGNPGEALVNAYIGG